jgi:hypothetical protein
MIYVYNLRLIFTQIPIVVKHVQEKDKKGYFRFFSFDTYARFYRHLRY